MSCLRFRIARALLSRARKRLFAQATLSARPHGGSVGTGPLISAISSGTPGATSATITWTTDMLSDSQVFWGTTAAYTGATSPIINSALVTSHSVVVSGLITATLYHYKVRSRDPATGGFSDSADATFTTA